MTPRILAKTLVVTREVVTVKGSDGIVVEAVEPIEEASGPSEFNGSGNWNLAFWSEVLRAVQLDDPEVELGRAPRLTYHTLALSPNVWLSMYRNFPSGIGVFIGCSKNNQFGQAEIERLVSTFPELRNALGETVVIERQSGRNTIGDHRSIGHLDNPEDRQKAIAWLRERTNTFVNVIKPLIKSWADEDEG